MIPNVRGSARKLAKSWFAVVKLGRKGGQVTGHLTSPDFDVPTTIAPHKRFIYAVNARFDRPDDSDADVVRVKP